jgi:hypothetical protein
MMFPAQAFPDSGQRGLVTRMRFPSGVTSQSSCSALVMGSGVLPPSSVGDSAVTCVRGIV